MRNSVAIAFLALLPAMAQGEIFRCDIRPDGTGEWIPERLIFEHVQGQLDAEVWDPLIKYFIGDPIPARVVVENDKRLTISWEIKDLTNRAGPGRQFTSALAFRATLLKPSLRLIVKSKPRGYSNDFRGEGQCRLLGR
ncbi:hypothetical protein [Aliiroseovarius sp. S253]|uniref:hypothetical protein n=1 Tax=Aliiroseovarius sp. S253 TaxID=3415133 RepID=UPI003C7E8108